MGYNPALLLGFLNTGSRERKVFNISWNSTTTAVTAYNPGEPLSNNANDRPRINTFRTDGTNVVFLSAGFQVWDPVTKAFYTPWGDRTTGTLPVPITLTGPLCAGVDFFTDERFPAPTLVPSITQWLCAGTGNPNEVKYQYLINKNSANNTSISITF